jgi:hypothetical protein
MARLKPCPDTKTSLIRSSPRPKYRRSRNMTPLPRRSVLAPFNSSPIIRDSLGYRNATSARIWRSSGIARNNSIIFSHHLIFLVGAIGDRRCGLYQRSSAMGNPLFRRSCRFRMKAAPQLRNSHSGCSRGCLEQAEIMLWGIQSHTLALIQKSFPAPAAP